MSDDILAFNRLRALSVGHPVPLYAGATLHGGALLDDLKALVRFTDDVVNDNAQITTERDRAEGARDAVLQVANKALKERDRLIAAVEWVVTDMAFKAPEQLVEAATAWHARLVAAQP